MSVGLKTYRIKIHDNNNKRCEGENGVKVF